jgi:hypothetical protein
MVPYCGRGENSVMLNNEKKELLWDNYYEEVVEKVLGK